MACQTRSGVPGTSILSSMERSLDIRLSPSGGLGRQGWSGVAVVTEQKRQPQRPTVIEVLVRAVQGSGFPRGVLC